MTTHTSMKTICSKARTHLVAICDDSGSMMGEPAQAATDGVRGWIQELQAETRGRKPWFRFSMIPFGSSATALLEGVSINDVDPDGVLLQGSSGSTNMGEALSLATSVIARCGAAPDDWPAYVFLFTDGRPDSAEEAINAASRLKSLRLPGGSPRIICIGFGAADEALLARLATSPEHTVMGANAEVLKALLPRLGTPTGMGNGATAADYDQQLRYVAAEARVL
jgi:uncharacterized protein YegL